MKQEILDNGLTGGIGEVHTLHLHIAPDIGEDLGILCVWRFGLGVNEPEHTLRRRKSALQLGDDVCHLVDRAGEPSGVLDEAA